MKRSAASTARELVEWLQASGLDGVRCVARRARRLRASSPREVRATLQAVFQAAIEAASGADLKGTLRGYLAGNLAYARRVRPVPLRLLLTLGLPVVTTLVLMQVVPAVQSSRADGCQWYTVQSGDTLGKLGSRFGETVAELAATNHIPNPDLIYVGQRLCISSTASSNGSDTPAKSTNTHATGEQAFVGVALPYAQRAHQQTGWPISLILAQWGVEQGWKTPGYTGFNWGNVAALPGEPTVGGIQKAGSPAAFAYATTPEDGLRYYVRVAQLGYYTAVAPAAAQSGVDAAARALGRSPWDAGHYTDHGDPGSSLLNMLHTYNLYQFDQ